MPLLLVVACGRDVTYAIIDDGSPAPLDEDRTGNEPEAAGAGAAPGESGADGPSTTRGEGTGLEGAGLEGAGENALDRGPASLLPDAPTTGADAGPNSANSGAADAGASSADPSCELGDAPAPAEDDSEPVAGELHCLLEAEWSTVVTSGPPGCVSLGSTLGARWFDWQGSTLATFDPAGTPFTGVGAKLERMRRCGREVAGGLELWRFEEHFELAGPLPNGRCPSQAFAARYRYTEHGKLPGPGFVFGADQPEACEFEACVRFVPSASGVATAPASSETQCGPSAPDEPTHAAPIGTRCRLSYECEAGSFCSAELAGGGCAPLGEEVCQRAPRIDECPAERELVCPCYREQVPDSNRCEQNARGVSTKNCP